MSVRRTRQYPDRPLEFSNPNGEDMRPIFDRVGLAGDTINERQRSQKIRSELVNATLLFTLKRPVHQRSAAHDHPHRVYTKAALEEAPDLRGYKTKARWSELTAHLQDFARRPEAQDIISSGISNYYAKIAELTVRLPGAGDGNGIWIPTRQRTPEGIDPMGAIGVLPRDVAGKDQYKDWSDHGRVYFNATEVATYIGWTIPGIETEATKTAILDKLTSTEGEGGVIDPLTLFQPGRVAIEGQEIPTSEVFNS
jgi:hypothetical protein